MTFEDRAAGHRERAAIALARQRWGEAVEELRALIVITPNDATAWNNLGVALERQQQDKQAVEAYAHATALAPKGRPQGNNLIREMQSYLGFAAALGLFKVIDIGLHFVPLPDDVRTAATVIAVVLLILGASGYYWRQCQQLPDEAWHAYKSEMARTRRVRYGGLAFAFVGFLAFAIFLFALVQLGGASDGTVVLVILAGLCWLIGARLLWAHMISPRLQSRIH